MSEFREVLHQMQRYCDTQNDRGYCGYCKLYTMLNYHCPLHSKYFVDNGASIEEFIMSWAAENPEPQYPTWGEWLVEQGVVIKDKVGENKYKYNTLRKISTPIPADTAKKLGIEPKEGI